MKTEVRNRQTQDRVPSPGFGSQALTSGWARSAALLPILLMVWAASAQTNFSINWFTIDGGGGTSTGGVYSVSGTIGQPDAGTTLRGGNYAVDGGFWGVIAAVQTPGAPWLTITRTATRSVLVSWPSATGWNLQQSSSMSPSSWTDVTSSPADDGTTRSVTVSAPQGNLFFRLKKQ